MTEKRFGKIDPRLVQVFKNTSLTTGNRVVKGLQDLCLVTKTGDDYEAQGDLTDEAADALINTLFQGLLFAFERCKVNIPRGYQLDEIELADSISEGLGNPKINRYGDFLGIRFTGPKPIIKTIIGPLNINTAVPEKKGELYRTAGIRSFKVTGNGVTNLKDDMDFLL